MIRIRRVGIAAAVVSALLLGSGRSSVAQTSFPTGCIGYCGNGIAIGIGVAVGAVATLGIVLVVNHNHHFVTGCVSNGADGVELQTSDTKTYTLEGDPSSIKIGDRVRLHGSTMKGSKNSSGKKVFKVDRLKRDYGPCNTAQRIAGLAAPNPF